MAILDLLKRTKKRVDDAIPDFNLTQKAGNVLRQANQIRQNLPIAQEGRRLTDMLAAQRERQTEQARLRQERQAQERERRIEESRKRMEEMRAKEQEINRQREENQRKLRERASAVGKFAADIPKGLLSQALTTSAILADTGVKGLEKAEDIVTAPLGKKYKERLQNVRKRQSEAEDRILSKVQPLEEKKSEGFKNYLKGAYNQAVPTLRDVKTATPLQRVAALADAALTMGTGGAFAGLKQAGKQGAKQVAKQYAKTAGLGAASGAAGTATQKDATAKDIATGAVGGAVFGAGLKGAGDVAPIVARKAGSTLSKAKEGIASALQEPKFKPGFASTKPKKGLEPTQPKVDSIKTSAQQAKAEGKTFDEWVKKQGTNVYHGTNIKNAKMLKSKPRLLTPEEQNIYPTTVVGDTQIGVSTSKDKNISEYFASLQPTGKGEVLDFVLPKNAKIYKLPENVDAIDNLGLKELQRIKKLGYDAIEDVKNIGGESEIRVISPEILKTREQLKAEWDATQSQPKFKKGFISLKGKKGLEPAQPIVKLQTETPAISKTSRQLAEEAVQRATKEPISPEITPMARVSTKAEPSIPETIKTQGVKQDIPGMDNINIPPKKKEAVKKFVTSINANDPYNNQNRFQKIFNELKRTFVDEDAELLGQLRRIEKETGQKGLVDNFYLASNRVKKAESMAAARIENDADFRNAFKGLSRKDLNEFNNYSKARAELMNYGPDMKTSKPREELARIVSEGDAKFGDRYSSLNKYYLGLSEYAYKKGLIPEEKIIEYRQNPEYIRIQRDMEDVFNIKKSASGSRSLKSTSTTQKRVGSEREILDVDKTAAERAYQIEKEIQRNLAASSVIEPFGSVGLAKKLKSSERLTNKNTIGRFVEGKKELYEVDPDTKRIVENLGTGGQSFLKDMARIPMRLFRLGTTGVQVGFAPAAWIVDQAGSFIVSKNARATHNPVNIVKGIKDTISSQLGIKSEMWKKFENSGFLQTSFDDLRNEKTVNALIRKIRKGKVGELQNVAINPVRSLEDLFAIGEKEVRYQNFTGIYNNAKKRGLSDNDAYNEALLASAKNSVDFARGSDFTRTMGLFLPFFNAKTQGARQLLEAFKERPIPTTVKSFIVAGIPTIATVLYNYSDEKRKEIYQALAPDEKEKNFILISSDAKRNENGTWEGIYKIPKAQGFRELWQPLAYATELFVSGQSSKDVKGMLYDMLGAISGPIEVGNLQQIAGGFIPVQVKPAVEAALNKKLFSGKDIVPERMIEETEDPTKRAYDNTSGTAKIIANQLNISPLQVEAYLQGTFSGLAPQVLNTIDTVLANAGAISKDEIGGRSFIDSIKKSFVTARGEQIESQKTPGTKYYESVKEVTKDLSAIDKKAWDVLNPPKQNFLGEDVLDENKRIEKYIKAGIYAQYPNVLEASRKLNQLQVQKGNPSNPLFELPEPLLQKVLKKDALPPGAKDPELSKLRDEEWYQNYLNARGKYYEQVKENLKLQGKEIPAQKNPYPTTPPQLQQAMDFYFDLPNSKAKSNWKKANPGLWEQMKAQWAQVDAWENKERVAIGLAETPTDETSGAVGKGKGGKGKKIKLAPVPKAKDTIEISRLKRQKLPTLRLAPSRAKTPVLKLAKGTKSEPKKLTVRKIRVK